MALYVGAVILAAWLTGPIGTALAIVVLSVIAVSGGIVELDRQDRRAYREWEAGLRRRTDRHQRVLDAVSRPIDSDPHYN